MGSEESGTPDGKSKRGTGRFMKTNWRQVARSAAVQGAHALSMLWRLARRVGVAVARTAPLFWRKRWTQKFVRVALRTSRIGVISSAAAALVLFVLLVCLEPVRPGWVGVRAKKWGGSGIEARDFGPGLHWSVPGVHGWHFLPAGTQLMNFTWSPARQGEWPALKLRTSDGNPVTVLCAVPYRVRPGDAHRLVGKGLMNGLAGRVRTATEKVLLQELSTLSTEQLTSPAERSLKMKEIERALDAELSSLYVDVEAVFVHGVYFAQLYEKKLQQKQITRQRTLQSAVGTRVEEAKRRVELHEQETAASVKLIAANTDHALAEERGVHDILIAELEADAKAYGQRRRAETASEEARILADGQAELAAAESSQQERLQALNSSPGGRVWLAREAARRLKLREVVLDARDPRVPSVLDLDGMVKLLLGEER